MIYTIIQSYMNNDAERRMADRRVNEWIPAGWEIMTANAQFTALEQRDGMINNAGWISRMFILKWVKEGEPVYL